MVSFFILVSRHPYLSAQAYVGTAQLTLEEFYSCPV